MLLFLIQEGDSQDHFDPLKATPLHCYHSLSPPQLYTKHMFKRLDLNPQD